MTLGQRAGRRIKKIRKDQGLTQLDVAVAIGHKASSYIAKLENGGVRHPRVETLEKIMAILSGTLESLLAEINAGETNEAA